MDDGERIPLLPREGDGAEEGDRAEEQETSFGVGGGVGREAQERGARPKTKAKTKTKTSSYVNPSYEDDKNEDIDAIINEMLIGEKLTKEEKQRLKQFKEEEKVAIETTNYEDGSIEAGGYVGSIMISNKERKKFYFYGVAKNISINEFKRNYPNMDKSKLESLEFGMSEDGKPVVKIRRINGKPYSIDHEERKYTKGERKGQRMKYNDTIKEVLGKSLYDEIEGREGTINELNKANEELKKTIEEIRKKVEEFSQKEEENNNKIRELEGKSEEDEKRQGTTEERKRRRTKTNQEGLRRKTKRNGTNDCGKRKGEDGKIEGGQQRTRNKNERQIRKGKKRKKRKNIRPQGETRSERKRKKKN